MTDTPADAKGDLDGLPPGPWEVIEMPVKQSHESGLVVRVVTGGSGIAAIYLREPGAEAVARAIAAIPEMRLRAETFERQYRQACQDHAGLLAEVKNLRAEIERLRASELNLENRCRSYADIVIENKQLRAEIGVLRRDRDAYRRFTGQETIPPDEIDRLRAHNAELREAATCIVDRADGVIRTDAAGNRFRSVFADDLNSIRDVLALLAKEQP